MRRKTATRRGAGTVTVLVAICLTAILGVVGIALDGGMMLDNRRRVQATADAAALAAASDLLANYAANYGLDPSPARPVTSAIVHRPAPMGSPTMGSIRSLP